MTVVCMIDEELYEQAAEELNSDKRKPRLWARACALASDDHDEARYLYTNLRVEEMIHERNAPPSTEEPVSQHEAVPGKAAFPDEDAVDNLSLSNDIPGLSTHDLASEVISTKPELDPPDDDADLFSSLNLEPLESTDDTTTVIASSRSGAASALSPDSLTAEDAESFSSDENVRPSSVQGTSDFDSAFSKVDIEVDLNPDDVMRMNDASSDSISPIDGSTINENADTDSNPAASSGTQSPAEIEKRNQSAFYIDDNTDDFSSSGDVQTTEDEELQNLDRNQPIPDMSWLEDEIKARDSALHFDDSESAVDNIADRLAPPTDELHDSGHWQNETSVFREGAAEIAGSVEDEYSAKKVQMESAQEQRFDSIGDAVTADDFLDEPPVLDEFVDEASENTASAYDQAVGEHPADTETVGYQFTSLESGGRRLYEVFSRFDGKMRAVKEGVSFSALFFTLPWLLSRGMLGMSLVYVALWAVLTGGLLWTGLEWIDAGSDASLPIKLATGGFMLLILIGLCYVPFRYANRWHSRKLERRGYVYQAHVSANSRNKAITRLLDFVQ